MYKKIENCFEAYKLDKEEIFKAEQDINIQFPTCLKSFYEEIGYGFVKNEAGAINRLMDPSSCARIRLRVDEYEYDPDLEMYEIFEKDKLIFFEVNEGIYISIGINDEKIYFTDKLIAESLMEFMQNIVNPDYWH